MTAHTGRVLLVDDEQDYTTALARRMRARDLHVDVVTDGETALEMADDSTYGVIVLDLALPGAGGIETLRELRHHDDNLQVIIVTGHGDVATGVKAMKLGAMDFLEKPVEFPLLFDRVQQAIRTTERIHLKQARNTVDEIARRTAW